MILVIAKSCCPNVNKTSSTLGLVTLVVHMILFDFCNINLVTIPINKIEV